MITMPHLDPVQRLTSDIAKGARTLSNDEARFLVDAYYTMQENRKRSANQVRALSESGEPNDVLRWLQHENSTLENQVKRALDSYSAANPLGEWARSVVGIGPVIAAGLLAHIRIEKCDTAGAIWRFAGYDPTVSWGKGEKRPWNAKLKTLCWKAGESFVKTCNHESSFYGPIYTARKAYEDQKNKQGEYANQAAEKVSKVGKTTKAYKHYSIGKLPPGHIHARAKRYAVKLFLAHYFEVGCKLEGREVPLPYPIAQLGHVHKISPPNHVV